MFRRILFWFGTMLALCLAGFLATTFWFRSRPPARGDVIWRLMNFQVREVVRTYETEGPEGLARILAKCDREFGGKHYLLDARGIDLVTGEDRSDLLKAPEPGPRIPFIGPRQPFFRRMSADNKYIFVVQGRLRGDPWADVAIFGWVTSVIVLFCYVLAWRMVQPIRRLREAVVRFGRGDLSSRVESRSKDELGDLAQAFNEMADRIETLLTAERRLLQDISHELRSPLARLRFALELAKSSADPQTAFDRVNKEVERLATLIGELLQVTRVEGDPASRNVGAIDLTDFLKSLAEDCAIEAEARKCKIDLSVNEKVTFNGDRELLHRAVENILRNAIRHAPEGTPVQV
ncbi:MAG: HAMP domain-containing protein, partial [Bryobacteraceae bacterium]|nr:HAMP domain-containing protein [Bryobacteraceae bacterium]